MRLSGHRIVGHLDLQRGALDHFGDKHLPRGANIVDDGNGLHIVDKSRVLDAQQTLDQLRNFQSSPNSLGVRQTNVVAALIGEAEYILDFCRCSSPHHRG